MCNWVTSRLSPQQVGPWTWVCTSPHPPNQKDKASSLPKEGAQAVTPAVPSVFGFGARPSGGTAVDSSSGWRERTGAVDPAAPPPTVASWPCAQHLRAPLAFSPVGVGSRQDWPPAGGRCARCSGTEVARKVPRQDAEPSIPTVQPKGHSRPPLPASPSPGPAGAAPSSPF